MLDNFPTELSKDAFCRGRFYVMQLKSAGHKIGMDAMLLAATVPNNFSGHIADFGSGSGGAGFSVIARCQNAKLDLVENSPIMIELAKKSLGLAENKSFFKRVEIINCDICQKALHRVNCGLKENTYDFIITNPPYNENNSQTSQDKLRAKAHVKTADLFEKWIKAATFSLKSKGKLSIIVRAQSLGEIINLLEKRFGNVIIFPIQPTKNDDASRILIIATKNSRAKLSIKPAIIIRELINGKMEISQKFDELINGLRTIYDN